MEKSEHEYYKTLGKYQDILREKGYTVLAVMLYGSQNYNLHDVDSDIDAKAIIMPSVRDILTNATYSTTIETPTGNIDVKDLYTFYEVAKKGNVSFIEPINSGYLIGDSALLGILGKLKTNPMSIYGQLLEKRKALTHPYPSKIEIIKEHGYDGKQLSHMKRLLDLFQIGRVDGNFESYIKYHDPEVIEELISMKRNAAGIRLSTAELLADEYVLMIKELADQYKQECGKFEQVDIESELVDYMEGKLTEQLFKTSPNQSVRQYRTFNNGVPKKDLADFPALVGLKDKDFQYWVYSFLVIDEK